MKHKRSTRPPHFPQPPWASPLLPSSFLTLQAEAEAEAEAAAYEEARRAEWARYYAWLGAQQAPSEGREAGSGYGREVGGEGEGWQEHTPSASVPAPSGIPPAGAGRDEYETDLSNLILAWYHCGFYTARFQDRYGKQ